MEYYSVKKRKNEIMSFVGKWMWMKLEIIMLYGSSSEKYGNFPFIYRI
jgi:hypothetical protein